MDVAEDPDFAGPPASKDEPIKGQGRDRSSLLAWSIVYLCNLVFPLFMGWQATRMAGRFGMFLAILSLFLAGYLLSLRSQKTGKSLVVGGVIVAVFQLLPFPQMFAAIIGLKVTMAAGQIQNDDFLETNVNNELGGFIATMVTGGVLMVAAFLIGGFLRCLWAWIDSEKSASANLGKYES